MFIFYFIYFAAISSVFIVISFKDWFYKIVPNWSVASGLFVFLVAFLISFFAEPIKINIISSLIGMLIGGGFLGALVLISGEKWMGMGDAKLGLLAGLVLGYPSAIVWLALSFILGAFIGVGLIAAKIKTRKDTISFGAILAGTAIIVLVFGNYILGWYLQ